MTDVPDFIVRNQTVRFTTDGLARLNDVWAAAGAPKNRLPADWMRLPTTNRLVNALLEKSTGKSHNWTDSEVRSVHYVKHGIGTFADIRLALAYAEYLDAKLALEVREVFLRYKAGDPLIADEVLSRATAEANEWVARRAMGRVVRNQFTNELHTRGVSQGREYAICTNVTYERVLGGPAKALKAAKRLPAKANLRDNLNVRELAFIAAAEALSVERMEEEDSHGFVQCHAATNASATVIGRAIAADRLARKKAK
ncbi:KilA-N domain-containing protein [Devosia honganensis]|uniref:KilA-N domain-containing protein n=1 Tax=Devosia honganensis TaxID=1610527 RepID=A0ABV7X8F2_9HYPH